MSPIISRITSLGGGGTGGFTFGKRKVPANTGLTGNRIVGASGGTLVSPNPGGYEIRHFPSGPTSFSYTDAGSESTIDIFMIGGGGSGGNRGGGGGGAGGAIYYPQMPLSGFFGPNNFSISIGQGGASVTTSSSDVLGGNAGGSTIFAPGTSLELIAVGGGGGRGDSANDRNNNPYAPSTPQNSRGGSGGGQHECSDGQATDSNGYQTSSPLIPTNSRTYGYGNPGGRSNPGDSTGSGCPLRGGGGGGAGGGGSNSGSGGGPGGPGIGPPIISWMPASLGDGGWFGGGGGGGVHGSPSTGGSGGQGGGGAAYGRSGPYGGYPGTNGTGGGGGGASVDSGYSPASTSGSGGSGIVVIRYFAN